ncbi:MAG: Stk1 family PASTA domain-containing Ser/Thr kinase [Clostridia bacterium]|nr:Stk1 family PASTA domain-containing Ser/Thr kinase [Clostridia bacterium]
MSEMNSQQAAMNPPQVGIGTVLSGKFRLVEQVGTGGMSVVYRAVNVSLGTNVAVKLLKPEYASNEEYVRRFQNEAEAASRLNHANIVQLLDVGSDGPLRYLVMEYVAGRTLKQIISEQGTLDPVTAANITLRVLSALQHAHARNVIHRDIKPQNIMVSNEGYVKLSDFGIAHVLNRQGITKKNEFFGTVDYISPEQARGEETDARSDIYSTGVVLYEMLTGRVPFTAETPLAVAVKHIEEEPVPVCQLRKEVPEAIAHVAMVAMRKDPIVRYQCALDMAEDLSNAIKGVQQGSTAPPLPPSGTGREQTGQQSSGGTAKQSPAPKRLKTKSRRARIWQAVSVLATALVLFGLVFGSRAIYDSVINFSEVPDLVGQELATAERAAAQRGLKLKVVESSHPSVSAGRVILQAPEVGTTLKKGDTIVLTVSSGPAVQLVPQVTGMTLSGAIAAAQSMGLTLTVVERVPSQDIAVDEVLSQVPQSGAECHAGDIIQVTVSGGVTEMPDVVASDITKAMQTLLSAGLKVNPSVSIVTTEDAALHGTVASQSLEAGSQVILGTSVTLSVYRVPSLTHSAPVTLDLPDTQSVIAVRVTLSQGSGEVTVYRGDVAADAPRNPEITVQCAHPGTYTLKVYMDETYKYNMDLTVE